MINYYKSNGYLLNFCCTLSYVKPAQTFKNRRKKVNLIKFNKLKLKNPANPLRGVCCFFVGSGPLLVTLKLFKTAQTNLGLRPTQQPQGD